MKVISLLQPWATLVVMGAKKIETRSWNTKYRGELLIHASVNKKAGKELCGIPGKDPFKIFIRHYTDLPYGAIIGKVYLCDTLSTEIIAARGLVNPFGTEDAFGDYECGRFGWFLKNPVQFAEPIPAKGSLGLWDYDMPEHFHVANKYGGHATFPTPPTKETLDAVNKLADVAFHKSKKIK